MTCFYKREMLIHATAIAQWAALLCLLLLLFTAVLLAVLVSMSKGLLPISLPVDSLTSNGMAVLCVQTASASQLFTLGKVFSSWRHREKGNQRGHFPYNLLAEVLLCCAVTIWLVQEWPPSAITLLFFGSTALFPLLLMGVLDGLLITVVALGFVLFAVVCTRLEDSEDEMSNEYDEE